MNPWLGGGSFLQLSGSYTHPVRPVAGSIAATWLSDVLVYKTPFTMIGVASNCPAMSPGVRFTTSISGEVQRQATRRPLTFCLSIWSRGEYLALALLAP